VTTERLTSTTGMDLALHHFGGTGPTLLICHATGFHARCYLPMLSKLTEEFDVWGVDFRGHGDSSVPDDGDFAWTGFADDLLAAIDHIGAPSVRAFGHSMGGTAALLAEKKRPGVIEAAWLYEPIIFPATIVPQNSVMAEAAGKRRREFDSRAQALHRYASRPPLGVMRADALAAYVEFGFHDTETGTVTLACAPETEAATFNNAGTNVDDIAGLQLRATIASGYSAPGPNPAEFAKPTADALPQGTLAKYDGLGHFGPMQDPDRIAADASTCLVSVS